MSASFEGDLIRPLGLITLYFGYAEFEVDALLDALSGAGIRRDASRNAPLGQKLAFARAALVGLQLHEVAPLISLIDEARPLIERRNVLVHSSIVAGGRVTPSDRSQRAFTVIPAQLVAVAEEIFTWKEKLSALRQKQLGTALQRSSHAGT